MCSVLSATIKCDSLFHLGRGFLPSTHHGAGAHGLRGGGAAAGGDALRGSGNTPV